MLAAGIKSKPVYRSLTPDGSGLYHLLIGQGQGAQAIERLSRAFEASAPQLEIFYSRQSLLNADESRRVLALPSESIQVCNEWSELEVSLRQRLKTAQMGVRLYIAGSEPFIWRISNLALEFEIREDEIQQEQADSQARRLVCVHCNAFTYPVTTNIVCCSACARHLLVRDHFSRRLNAYMGVQVDAEVPGEIPPIAEVYAP